MNAALARRGVWCLSILLLTAPGLAQKTETSSGKKSDVLAPSPVLNNVFQRVRPASVQISDCDTVARDPGCTDPNGLGSGVLISADGSILTAYHVVFGASRLEAVTLDKRHYPVTVVGFDEPHDLALLKINIAGAPFVPLALVAPRVGQAALAIGNSGGKFLQPKTGKLLALNAEATRADFPPGTLQLTAPLAPGDSGGPILNEAGQLIGITSYIGIKTTSRTEALPSTATPAAVMATLETASYAVPVTASSELLVQLRAGLKREAPIVGINSAGLPEDGLTSSLLAQLGLGNRLGFVFTGVVQGGPADVAGLRPLTATKFDAQGVPTHATGDVITQVDGKRVTNYLEFLAAIRSHQVGDQVTLTVYRDGGAKPLSIPVTLAPRTVSLGQTKP
ncbi:S1C family serine protease [Deinococcus altitudinis]|uniref:S1C family serine protease n=1 Tax=Deinococcus altitudinis TaxID=468914 RepID=UPI0038928A5D